MYLYKTYKLVLMQLSAVYILKCSSVNLKTSYCMAVGSRLLA